MFKQTEYSSEFRLKGKEALGVLFNYVARSSLVFVLKTVSKALMVCRNLGRKTR